MHIEKINIKKILNFENFQININKKHLILTGKNGSGKTTLLNEIRDYLYHMIEQRGFTEADQLKKNINIYERQVKRLEAIKEKTPQEISELIKNRRNLKQNEDRYKNLFGKIEIIFSDLEKIFLSSDKKEFILAFFGAKRATNLSPSKGVEKIDINTKKGIREKSNSDFLKFLVHLKTQQAYALLNKNDVRLDKINKWFESFEHALKDLFEINDLQFTYDEEKYNFIFTENGKIYDFNTLSDGFSSVIDIISEIMYKMEFDGIYSANYDFNGIVLIDEIETHLHIELQKKILRILTNMFPNIQFIISTHSPFILSSVENAIVYDLENRIEVENLSAYSYDRIVETYFNNSKYGKTLEIKLNRYEELVLKKKKKENEIEEQMKLYEELKEISFEMAQEASIRFKEIEIKRIQENV